MTNDTERCLGWEDEIEHDSEFILLPDGDYNFEVISVERARHGGSDKLPPCNKAVVTIRIETEDGEETVIKHNLFLHAKTEGMLCAFFTGIGLRKHGEKLKMNWNSVVGAKGRCKVGQRSWTNDKGETYLNNDIKKFYEPEEKDDKPWAEGKF